MQHEENTDIKDSTVLSHSLFIFLFGSCECLRVTEEVILDPGNLENEENEK